MFKFRFLKKSFLLFICFLAFNHLEAQVFCNEDVTPPNILDCPDNAVYTTLATSCAHGIGFRLPTQVSDDCDAVNGFSAADFFNYYNQTDAGFGDNAQFIQYGFDSILIVGTTNGNAGINNRFNVCFYAHCNGEISFNWRARVNNGDGFAGDRVRLMIDHQGHNAAVNINLTPGNGNTANGLVLAQTVQAGDRICFEVQSDNQGGVDSFTVTDFVFIPTPIQLVQTKGPLWGHLFTPGQTHLMEFTATDCSGNTSTCQFTIEVQNEPGKNLFSYCPNDTTVILDYASDCDTIVNWLTPITMDPCSTRYDFKREMDPRIIGPILEEFAEMGMGDGIIGTDGILWLSANEDSLRLVGINNGTPGNARNDTSSIKACVQPICPGTVTFDWSASIEAIIGSFNRDEAGIIFNGKDSVLSVPPSAYYASGTVSLDLDGINPLCFYVRSTNMANEDTLTITNFSITYQDPVLTQISGVDINTPIGPGIYDYEFEAEDCFGNLDTCTFQVTVIGSGPMSCKDINVSLDNNCEILITPDMLVTGVCTGTMIVELSHYGHPVNNPLDSSYLGKHIKALVTDTLTGNSCWSDIWVEDKLAPEIICHADTVDCNLVEAEFPLNYEGHDCSHYQVRTIAERFEHYDCNDLFLKAIFRDIEITDYQGYKDLCTDTIFVKRIPQTEVYFPYGQSLLFCDFPYEKDENGNPSPLVTGYPYHIQSDGTLNGIWPLNELLDCHLFISYEDQDLGEINCVRKIMRTWTIREWWCHREITRNEFQIIIIEDKAGPEITHMPYGFDATTGNRSCTARVLLPSIEAKDACHDNLRIDIAYPGGILLGQNGGWVDLPVGKDTIYYRVYDACYNLTEAYIIVNVIDETEPVAVCDRNTVVALNRFGETWVPAEVFDDGSFDECAIHHFEVRRMDRDFCGGIGEDDWGEEVGFCCEDVNKTIMVGFKVIDHSGNEAICMVNVEVQDKEGPQISCPPNITVDCRFDIDYNHLEVFGKVVTDTQAREKIVIDPRYWHNIDGHPLDGYAADNCPPTILERLYLGPELNQCGIGAFYRYFAARDQQGNYSQECFQRITVINHKEFDESDIEWPQDFDTVGICDPTELIPERLSYPHSKPVVNDDECSLIGMSYHDHVLSPTIPGDPCFKILRVWKVIDWCQRDKNNEIIIWQDTQYIKVINVIDPTILRVSRDTVVCSYDVDCRPIPVSFSIEADDDCTDPLQMLYTYKIDLNSDGTIDVTRSSIGGRVASGTWPIGKHLVKWEVEDRCGNTAKESFTLELRNCKPPVAYCLNGLSTSLTPMDTDGNGIPDTAMDTVWAKDFDAGSYHNCNYYVTLSFSKDTNNRYVVYDCDSLGVREVELWVTDINGNTSFCRTFIDVQDNTRFCPPTIRNSNVSGIISTERTDRVENVKVELLNSGRQEIMTNAQGQYAFDQLPTGTNYELRPGKNDGWLNGVTTGDIVKIQRHILGLEVFDSPYKMIAADANRSGSITAKDVSELRRLILGVTNEIAGNTSWRFVHQLYSFKDVSNALNEPFTESYAINSLQSNMALDFYAVKVGDVNGTAATKGYNGSLQGRNHQVLELEIEDQELQRGEEVEMELRVKQGAGFRGMQFTLEWPVASIELVGVETSQRNKVKEENYSAHRIQEGKLSFSWEGQMSDGMELLKLKWRVHKGIKLSESLRITDGVTPALSVGEDGTEGSVVLNYRGMTEGSFVVLPNEPNPWTRTTMVGMILPQAGEIGISVYDATGKVYLRDRLELTKGYHEYQISRDQLSHAGLYYIQLDFMDRSHTGRMILID